MGLDCYVCVKDKHGQTDDIWYGRKENEIHGWMQRKSGVDPKEFNCTHFPLTKEILDSLEEEAGNLESTSGFFFGAPNDRADVLVAVDQLLVASRIALMCGKEPFYFAWF